MPKENNQIPEQLSSVEKVVEKLRVICEQADSFQSHFGYTSDTSAEDILLLALQIFNKTWEQKLEKAVESERERILNLKKTYWNGHGEPIVVIYPNDITPTKTDKTTEHDKYNCEECREAMMEY